MAAGIVERPTIEEVRAARELLADVVVHTPLVPLQPPRGEPDLWLKPEIHQPGGSFKIRGVFHAVARMTPERRAAGISTVSAGNTAKALAWAGAHFGVEARSLMPEGAPQTKVDAVRALGGTPVLVPTAEVFRFLKEAGWEREPYAFVHPWIERDVLIGHGTLALELLEDLPALETVFVPVGGGGLMGGVASTLKALKPELRIVAVEPEGCPSLHASLRAGSPQSTACDTICDGVAVPYMTEEMFPLLAELVDDCVLVSEVRVRAAIRELALEQHLVAEGAGALAWAAATDTPVAKRGRSVCVVTGGSIDASRLAGILSD